MFGPCLHFLFLEEVIEEPTFGDLRGWGSEIDVENQSPRYTPVVASSEHWPLERVVVLMLAKVIALLVCGLCAYVCVFHQAEVT